MTSNDQYNNSLNAKNCNLLIILIQQHFINTSIALLVIYAVNDDVTTANMFNKEFAKNFSPAVAFTLNAPSPNQHDQIFNTSFTDTYAVLATSSSSSAGPNGISGRVLRNLAHVLTITISIIFQQSLA